MPVGHFFFCCGLEFVHKYSSCTLFQTHTPALKRMHTPVPHTHVEYTPKKGEDGHVLDFEGVLGPVLLAVVNLQCGRRRVIAL